MAEEILGDIHEEVHATVLSHSLGDAELDGRHEGKNSSTTEQGVEGLEASILESSSNLSGSSPNHIMIAPSSGVNFSKLLSFVGSCSINLLVPFLNGLMLGFGELLAHEISWKFTWFNRERNSGYRIYPETRKLFEMNEELKTDQQQQQQDGLDIDHPNSDGFL
ncbi:HFR069Wp [Eremothecium sinecaudum]|uniref:HFR069Wp n=1 Tax=Eremothecium sinecaudum TaxID=45286 RepID=A0A0X8HV02_9SACH|nr:HFR069Wp [Eremothecium sinecaudum]AMD21924.1 HFR069Wp [Eremothecium sinecaudum]